MVGTRIALAVFLVVLGWIVFPPAGDASRVTGVVAWAADVAHAWGIPRDAVYTTLEFLSNVALFVPFGVLGVLSFKRVTWWTIGVLGLGTSVLIELV